MSSKRNKRNNRNYQVVESYGLALSTPKRNSLAKDREGTEQTVSISSQTRSKSNVNAKGEVSQTSIKEVISGEKKGNSNNGSETSLMLEGILGSPSAKSTPTGANGGSRSLDLLGFHSEFSFIYNPLTPPRKETLIGKKDRGDVRVISDALNEMYAFMQTSHSRVDSFVRYSQEKFVRIDNSITSIMDRVDKIETACRNNDDTLASLSEDKVSKSEVEEVKVDMNRLKSELRSEMKNEMSKLEKAFQLKIDEAIIAGPELQADLNESLRNQQADLDTQQMQLNDMTLDIKRVINSQSMAEEKLSARDIQAKHLFLVIEGLPESDDKTVVDTIIDRFNNDAKANLAPSDFVFAYRASKERFDAAGARFPQQIKVKMANDQSRGKLLACRGKLQANPNKTFIWINEVHPDEYRRRKLMLKELVKHINKKKDMNASIESGGLRLNGEFYGPDDFGELPPECQPKVVQVINIGENGLAFAGEWAFLSNMYSCPVRYDNIRFLSSEQAYQYTKAMTHGALGKATRILLATDAFSCKRFGDKVEDSEDWLQIREEVLQDIILAKFQQNPVLRTQLLDTGDATLLEATVDHFWGIGSGIRSKATRESTATGKNRTGHILMDVRAKFTQCQKQDE